MNRLMKRFIHQLRRGIVRGSRCSGSHCSSQYLEGKNSTAPATPIRSRTIPHDPTQNLGLARMLDASVDFRGLQGETNHSVRQVCVKVCISELKRRWVLKMAPALWSPIRLMMS